MLIELSKQFPLKYYLFSEQKSQLIHTRVLQNIEINVLDLLFIQILLNDVKNFLVFQRLFADI
jgi:hypothetical protein